MGADKRHRGPTFADIAASARKTTGHPLDGRHHKRVLGDDAWDPQGRYWERQKGWLTREEVEELLAGAVLVVVEDIDGAQWYSREDGIALWRKGISAHFIENNTVKHMDEAGFPDDAVYSATVRRRPDGEHLIWLHEHC